MKALPALALCATLPTTAALAQPVADTIPRATRDHIVATVRDLVSTRFAHFAGIPGFDFGAEFERYRARALATTSRWTFSLETRAFIASLRNGHTTFADPWMRDADPAQLPFTLGFLEGQWVITTSRHPGLAVGDVVLSIDGAPSDSMYRTLARYISASSDRMRRREFTARGFLWPHRVTLGLEDGRRLSVERSAPPPDTALPTAVVRDRWIDPGRVGYVAIRSFNDPEAQSRAVSLVTGTYHRATTLIVDVRDNGGGNTPGALTRALLHDAPYHWWKEDPDLVPAGVFDRLGARVKRALARAGPTFAGQVVVLVNAGCGSACEDFVMPLAWQHRAFVIGDTTAGTTGQPVFARFDNGMQVSVSARRAQFPDGSPFEGVGIVPDLVIPTTRRDLGGGQDRVLEAAIARARSSPAQSPR